MRVLVLEISFIVNFSQNLLHKKIKITAIFFFFLDVVLNFFYDLEIKILLNFLIWMPNFLKFVS